MREELLAISATLAAICTFGDEFKTPPRDCYPQTWFHMIGGNVSKAGLTADLEAISESGISGIQLFHGQVGTVSAWPRTHEQIPCLSEKWEDTIRHAADECERLGLKFEMQNCPGWSMSGGPWITKDKAMRKLVCHEVGRLPKYAEDDDYRFICRMPVPKTAGWGESDYSPSSITTNGTVRTYVFDRAITVRRLILSHPRSFNAPWVFEPKLSFRLECRDGTGWRKVTERNYPDSCWQDTEEVDFAIPPTTADEWRLTLACERPLKAIGYARFSPVARFDNWRAMSGWVYRRLPEDAVKACETPLAEGMVELEFGHVNAKLKNHPAPAEATGWECDKLDARGVTANFAGYIGKLAEGALKGGKLKGIVVDSWECRRQNWTWNMEEKFGKLNGYELRPMLPALFGYPTGKGAAREARFLRDWRFTISRLIEENYYRVMAELAHKHNLTTQFEAAFGDVIHGDLLRYWKYADVPMTEFWQPHDWDGSAGGVGNEDYKPVKPCVSASHLYGKGRVAAEAFTSFKLTWRETFEMFKSVADVRYARGVTHLVFHTYTHNPQTGKDFLPPGTSFGTSLIGSPFLRGQTWWKYMPSLTAYFARCGWMLERGKAAVDVLWYLGDDFNHRPSETAPFPAGYKTDYCNFECLKERVKVSGGRLVLPDGMSYRMLWIPNGTWLSDETTRIIAGLERAGAKVVRGEFRTDLPPDVDAKGLEWYHRIDGDSDICFFAAPKSGWDGIVKLRGGGTLPLSLSSFESVFAVWRGGEVRVLDPVTGAERENWKNRAKTSRQVAFTPEAKYPEDAVERIYSAKIVADGKGGDCVVSFDGLVGNWFEPEVNGRKLGVVWCAPYAVNIAPYLRKGDNVLKVKATTPWHRKLLKDAGLPENQRSTWKL